MNIFCDRMYFEVGDSVNQNNYPGCPAKVIEVIDRFQVTHYRLQIDATGHPEAIDENGEPQTVKYAVYSDDLLIKLNPDMKASNAELPEGHDSAEPDFLDDPQQTRWY